MKNKYDHYRRAKRTWLCFDCGYAQNIKMKLCKNCIAPVEYFSSKTEASRAWILRQLLHKGMIQGLHCHPKYKLEVCGDLITIYSADFMYINQAGRLVIEDVKANNKFCDRESLIKIKLFNALHKKDGLKIVIKT